jgi:transposase-like protein
VRFQAHLAKVYGTNVARETVSKITDAVGEEMSDWLNRPLEPVYGGVHRPRPWSRSVTGSPPSGR